MPPHCAHVIYGVGNISPPHHRVALPDAVMRKMVTQQRKSPPFSLSLHHKPLLLFPPLPHYFEDKKKQKHPDTPHGEVCVFCFLFFFKFGPHKGDDASIDGAVRGAIIAHGQVTHLPQWRAEPAAAASRPSSCVRPSPKGVHRDGEWRGHPRAHPQ